MRTLITFLFALLLSAGNTIAQPGAIDHTFNADDFGFGYGDGPNGPILSMASQPDGKVILVGEFTTYNGTPRNGVARINTDGSLDLGFNPGVGANEAVRSCALQSDGKIIIGGNFTAYNSTSRNRVARLHADGSMDATFDPGLGANGPVNSVAVRTDGKVYVGCSFNSFHNTPMNGLCRLDANGALDVAFNANGEMTFLSGILSCIMVDLYDDVYIGTSSSSNFAKLYPTGAIQYWTSTGANCAMEASIRQILRLSNGAVIIFGGCPSIGPYPSAGIFNIRNSWGADIINLSTNLNGPIDDAIELPGSRILIVGGFTTYAGIARNGIALVDFDGNLDPSFAPDVPYAAMRKAILQPDGKVVITGGLHGLIRLNPDGSLDMSYPVPGTGANGEVRAITVQPDGKILTGGIFQAYNGSVTRLARLQPDGSLDTNFETTLPGSSNISSIALQSNGKVLIAGTFPARIARFNSDGSPDNGFSPPQIDDIVQTVAAQPDGRIMIGGLFTTVGGQSRNRVARLNADGSVQLSFDPGSGADGAVRTIVPMPAGKTLIGGAFNNYGGFSMAHVAQLNADGTLDPSFNIGSGITDDTVRVIVRQSDGKVLVAGDFYVFNGVYSPNIVRLNTDGSMDTTFSSGFGVDGRIHCMALQADGKILIGGEFSTYDGIGRNRIAKLNSDGSLDMGFNPGTGASATIHALALQPDGKALIGGAFTSYNGTGRNRLARLHNDIGSGVQEYETLALFGHPNPTKGIVTLQLPLQIRPSELSILDATGRLVLSQAIGNATSPVTVDLSGQESGMYFVHVRFADGTRTVGQVVKE